jgi:nitrogen regulatory protein PII
MQGMTKVEALIRPWKFEDVRDALLEVGVEGITVSEVVSFARKEEHTSLFRGQEIRHPYQNKIKLELVLLDDMVERVVQAIATAAHTGEIGDGNIILSPIFDAVRIRNGNQGIAAL